MASCRPHCVSDKGPGFSCSHSASLTGKGDYLVGFSVNFNGNGKYESMIFLSQKSATGVKSSFEVPMGESSSENSSKCVSTPIPAVEACLSLTNLDDSVRGSYGSVTADVKITLKLVGIGTKLYEGHLTKGEKIAYCGRGWLFWTMVAVLVFFSVWLFLWLFSLIPAIQAKVPLKKLVHYINQCFFSFWGFIFSFFASILIFAR
tara:strand:+ start:1105 stop:1716 length:612 start_codon:yes stop_codon:yes gene_type:complete